MRKLDYFYVAAGFSLGAVCGWFIGGWIGRLILQWWGS